MAIFVINEWLWADSAGDNGPQAQNHAFNIITMLAASDHQIAVIEGSPFDRKAWNICKSTDTIISSIARTFVLGLRQNSNRCLILKPESVAPFPEVLAPNVKLGDRYLVQTQLTLPGAILVTTDEALCEAVKDAGFACLLRNEFLNTYF